MDYLLYYKDYLYGVLRTYIQQYVNTEYNVSKITDNIYISDLASSQNKDRLKEDGITHILSAVLGFEPTFPDDFNYMNIYVRDIETEDLSFYFDVCGDYIHKAINNNGKVLVHCSYGISRSASLVIAYLIKYKEMPYDDAYMYVKKKRNIIEPNEGFKRQLNEYYKLNAFDVAPF